MDDVNDQIEVQPQAEETAEQPSQPAEQTPETPVVDKSEEQTPAEEASERMVPISVVQKERKERQRYQRELAELKAKQSRGQTDPEDYEAWVNNPLSQELIIKQARQELTDYARETLDNYPNLPPVIKKAILKNVRGFVNEQTTDIETAKVDLLQAIEDIADEAGVQQTQLPDNSNKGFKVAQTNVPATEDKAVGSAEVDAILAKPITEWTSEEEALLEDYRKRNAK